MNIENLLVTTPYVTQNKLQAVYSEMEKQWEAWESDPDFIYTVINMQGENYTPMAEKTVAGITNKVSTTTKPVILRNILINNESAPLLVVVPTLIKLVSGGTTTNVYVLQSSIGGLYVFPNDKTIWITRHIPASAVIDNISQKLNTMLETSETDTFVETKLAWKSSISTDVKSLLSKVLINVIYKHIDTATNTGEQYQVVARNVTADGIYLYTFDEPGSGFTTVDRFELTACLGTAL